MRNYLFGRYVWLIEYVRNHRNVKFSDIADAWRRETSLNPDGEPFPVRTFHRHREAIADIFGIDIECDTGNDTYCIPGLDQMNDMRNWLLDSYATLNQLKADQSLTGRILFEDIPSGRQWLPTITNAMRQNMVLRMEYHSMFEDGMSTTLIEPYALKVSRRRWYVVARNSEHGHLRNYALDRIEHLGETDWTFEVDKDFDIEKYFEGCCGIITDIGKPVERVVVAAYGKFANYLRTLPIHVSQREQERDNQDIINGRTRFEVRVRPTLDFYQQILSYGGQVKVLEPAPVAKELVNMASNIVELYKSEV